MSTEHDDVHRTAWSDREHLRRYDRRYKPTADCSRCGREDYRCHCTDAPTDHPTP